MNEISSEPADHPAAPAASFPIVAIGASAGGLEALRLLFSRLPADTGMAFVVIQHLDPARPSLLSKLLESDVPMPVVEAADGMRAEPDRVYVTPSTADLSIHSGVLGLVRRERDGGRHLPIDAFFRSLAADSSARAIGVVLSGSASDGTDGLRAIKAAGGIAMVQAPASAQFASMPESAIAADVVDFCSPPAELADELVRLSRHPYLITGAPREGASPDEQDAAGSILAAIRRHTHLDFRGYKRPTILRRAARRMALRQIASLDDYAQLVRQEEQEARALADDILIHVTSFFRDPPVFEALERLLPELLAAKDEEAPVRVWVPGCSTGQEAYSLAICLLEAIGKQDHRPPVKIFGSDLSERAIKSARAGLYTEADLEGVSRRRRERFFERSGDGYRVGREIRDLCVFVQHDLTRDPPFAKLDLISCRNVLIYFDTELQRRTLPVLHHCLNDPGYLILGSSEGLREFAEIFAPVDKEQRIFRRQGDSPRIDYPLAFGRDAEARIPVFQAGRRPQPVHEAQRQADHLLLARYAPPGVVVDESLQVIQFRGRTGSFLEAPPGQPQTNVLRMAREGLVGHLHEALEAAKAGATAVRRQGVHLKGEQGERCVDIEVLPLVGSDADAPRHFLVLFEESGGSGDGAAVQAALAPPAPEAARAQQGSDEARLRTELAAMRGYLESITGEHQDAAEELSAANEELVAANEELQSTNEELQSAKEELQSTNEELTTVNAELHDKNEQLDQVADDLVNVLESVQIPVIMVDQALHIRRFTPITQEISSLVPADVGRSIDDVKLRVRIDDLVGKIRETIDTVCPKEYEVQSQDGRWFRLHIRPYRTSDQLLDGAVLSFLDVDGLKRALQDAERSRDYARRIVETVPMSLAVLDRNLCVMSLNPSFCRTFHVQPDRVAGTPLFELAAGALDVGELREAAEQSLKERSRFHDLELSCELPGGRRLDIAASGCPLQGAGGELMLLLAMEDVTERHLLEASEKHARVEAEAANRAKDLFLATLSHELRTPLNTILMSAQLLRSVVTDNPKVRRASGAIERAAGNQARLIDDLLDISRIVSGKLMLDLQAVDLTTVVQSAFDVAQSAAEAKGVELELVLGAPLRPVHGDPARLQQVVANLLNNAIKFTPAGGTISLRLEQADDQARITVADTGLGLHPDLMPHLFNRFVQAESSMTRAHGGLGLGLAIVRHIVDVHGGEVRAESPGEGQGSVFTVTLPLAAGGAAGATPGSRRTVARSIQGTRVLLVEDDEDTRDATVMMLEERGAEVRAASSASEGLAALDDFEPQVILCDIAMPGEDGYAFIRKLRSTGRDGQIPAAALTALAGEEDRRRALEAGFQMHLAKPTDSDRLATAIAHLRAWRRS